jgi:hypothetical protein
VSELNDEVRENEGGEMADACRVLGFILCTTNLGRPSDRRCLGKMGFNVLNAHNKFGP